MKRYLLLTLLIGFTAPFAAWAGDPTGAEIIDQVSNRPKPTDSAVTAKMILISKTGSKRERLVEMKVKEEKDGESKAFIRFLEPADVKGTSFLNIEHKDANDEQLLFLPALKKVRRIASSQKSESFMGTDFSYEDMESRDIKKEGTHTLLRSEGVDGKDCWVVESIPTKEADSQYGKLVNWIRKDILIPVKGEFYDKEGKLLKKLEVKNVEQIDGFWTPKASAMVNIQKDHQTVLLLQEVKNNPGLSDDIFTERNLTTP